MILNNRLVSLASLLLASEFLVKDSQAFSSAAHSSSVRRRNILKSHEKHGDNQDINIPDLELIDTRRRFLQSSLLLPLLTSSSAKADDNLLELDQQKIVMQMSSQNIPKKYDTSTNSSFNNIAQEYEGLTESEIRRIAVFEKAAPSVVYIDTFVEQRDQFSTNVMEVPIGTGSGFVWDDKGHIVTNYHVVRSAGTAQIAVLSRVFDDNDDDFQNEYNDITGRQNKNESASEKLKSSSTFTKRRDKEEKRLSPMTTMRNSSTGLTNYSRKVYKARVVGVDPGKDIAVLKIDAPVFDLYPIDVGTSTNLKVGQSAYAIGNPFGLDHTLTVGVVSGIGREVKSPIGRPITNVIQTDAAINPGNSGGCLLNSSGKLIGMNTSIYSPSGASAGIGFAIPVDTVKFIVETLIRDGKIVRPVLGISYLESKQARALGIERGVLVLDVPVNSPAYKAGMRGTRRNEMGLIEIGDIIVKIEDMKINTEADLFQALEMYKPGDVVQVKVMRPDLDVANGKSLRLDSKTLAIQLKTSTSVGISQYLYANPHGQ